MSTADNLNTAYDLLAGGRTAYDLITLADYLSRPEPDDPDTVAQDTARAQLPVGSEMRLRDRDGHVVRFARPHRADPSDTAVYVKTSALGSYISRTDLPHVITYLSALLAEFDAKAARA